MAKRKRGGALEYLRAEARERLRSRGVENPTIQQVFDAVDEVMREVAQDVARDLAQEEIDESERVRPSSCSSCGGRKLESKGRVPKTLVSMRGVIGLKRRRFACRDCGVATVPVDAAMAVPDGPFTEAVQRRISRLGQSVPFAEASELMHEIAGVRVSTTHCRLQTEADGDRLTPADLLPERPTEAPERITIAIDGCFVPVRPIDAAEPSRPFREVKLGVVTGEYRNAVGKLEQGPARYVTTVEDATVFRAKLYQLVSRMRAHEASHVTVISDGAKWIRGFVTGYLSGIENVTFILDFYHAAERIWDVARATYGKQSKAARAFATRTVAAMREGPPATVIRRLKGLRPPSAEARAIRDDAIDYLSARLATMDYATYQAANLPIGSGRIESACKHVVQQRAKQAGMRWRIADWQKVMNLRTARLNDRWHTEHAA